MYSTTIHHCEKKDKIKNYCPVYVVVLCAVERGCNPKISKLDLTSIGNEDVGGLDVSMELVLAVEIRQPIQDSANNYSAPNGKF